MSTHKPRRYYRPKCDQCQIMVVNGVVCHERGCPREPVRCSGTGCDKTRQREKIAGGRWRCRAYR